MHGDSLHHALVAVVSVDAAAARTWAAAHGLAADTPVATIVADARLKKAVLDEFSRIAKVRAPASGCVGSRCCSASGVHLAAATAIPFTGSPLPSLLPPAAAVAQANKLNGFEVPKDVHLDTMAWDAESGIVTPTFKLKRHDARLFYAAQVRLLVVC